MIEREGEFRTIGVVYLILGFWFLANFLSTWTIKWILWYFFSYWEFFSYWYLILWGFSIVVGSVVLASFGVILMVRGGIWIARVSGVLGIYLGVSYISLLLATA